MLCHAHNVGVQAPTCPQEELLVCSWMPAVLLGAYKRESHSMIMRIASAQHGC